MKKLVLLATLIFLLNACASPEKKITQGKIKIGMPKYSFCYETIGFSGPCSATFGDGYNNKNRGLYYPDLKMEILWAPKPKSFFVFNKVTTPINWANYGKYMYEGNGYLEKIFNSKEEAIKYISSKAELISKDHVYIAKQGCKSEGLTPGTEKFAECSLKRIKELTSGTGQ
jgi:hypothetical protein